MKTMNPIAIETNSDETRLASTVYVGRQPIYTGDSKTFAYELLFRSNETNHAEFVDGERATAELLLNSFAEIGLERIVGNLPAFINVPEEFILNGHCFALPKDRVVIEVLEDVRPTKDVLAVLSKLRKEGYTIALDDFVFSPQLMPMVELANIIKVDLPLVPTGELAKQVNILRNHDLRILAEKVETQEEFEFCKELGFDYYQGYFFSRPTIVKGKKLSVNKVTMMRLVAKLQSSSVSVNEITQIIQTEPALAFKLLRYVNSAYVGLTHKIESIKHAATYAGIQQIKTICSMSLLVEAAEDKPGEFIKSILIRARMSELLATALCQVRTDSYFMVGLFSALDAMLDIPIIEALGMVSVCKEIEDAITKGVGDLGMVLNCVLEYEQGNWERVSCGTLSENCIQNSYLNAIAWANTALSIVDR